VVGTALVLVGAAGAPGAPGAGGAVVAAAVVAAAVVGAAVVGAAVVGAALLVGAAVVGAAVVGAAVGGAALLVGAAVVGGAEEVGPDGIVGIVGGSYGAGYKQNGSTEGKTIINKKNAIKAPKTAVFRLIFGNFNFIKEYILLLYKNVIYVSYWISYKIGKLEGKTILSNSSIYSKKPEKCR
jgi:hypothetical protein